MAATSWILSAFAVVSTAVCYLLFIFFPRHPSEADTARLPEDRQEHLSRMKIYSTGNATLPLRDLNLSNPDLQQTLTLSRHIGGLKKRPPCPAPTASTSAGNLRHATRYVSRARDGQCSRPEGMWSPSSGPLTGPFRKAKYELMAMGLGLREGKVVLDWGTGCGKELHEVAKEKGFTAVGVDLVEDLIKFANQAYGQDEGSQATYCRVPAGRLPFDDGSFDAVISNGALYHMVDKQKHVEAMQDVVRVLRPGGCAWMAWLGCDDAYVMQQAEWNSVELEGATISTVNEIEGFGWTEYFCPTAYSLIVCKSLVPCAGSSGCSTSMNLPPSISKRISQFGQMTGLQTQPTCPEVDEVFSALSVGNIVRPNTYITRAKDGQCSRPEGMWSSALTAPLRKAKYELMAVGLGLHKGQIVLDWGTGCGKELHAVAKEKGFTGVGVDLVEDVIEFANKAYGADEGAHLIYCKVPGGKLPFADGSFDAVISNGALFHVGDQNKQVEAMRDVVRVLRPGGCAWMAYLGFKRGHADGDPMTMKDWQNLNFEGATLEVVNEIQTFGWTEYSDPDVFSLIACKD